MALSKIYIGSTLIMDGNDIANAIGNEVANASTFTELINAINTNKASMAANLSNKGVNASSGETLSSLVNKISNIIVNDISGIKSIIGNELTGNASVTDIVNALSNDKALLVTFLNLYGLTGQTTATTLSTLINQLGNINATRYYQLNESMTDFSAFNNLMIAITNAAIAELKTPMLPIISENITDLSLFDNLVSIADSIQSTVFTVLTNLMTSNTTGSLQSDLIPPMSSNTGIAGIASASSVYAGSVDYNAWKAFNGAIINPSDGSGGWVSVNGTTTGWLKFQFNTPQVVKQYNVVGWNYSASLATVQQSYPKNWTFEGSNDGNNWTVLDTKTNQSVSSQSQVNSYPISNTTDYLYYRLNISANNSYTSYVAVGQLVLLNNPVVGIASASSFYNSTYDAWKAFNQSFASDDCWISANNTLTGWLQYLFPLPKVVNRYELYPRNESSTGVNSFPKNWTFEAGNDGTNWAVLDTQVNQSVVGYTPDCFKSYSINNTGAYAYYRINITDNNGNTNYTAIGEFRLAIV